LAQLAHHYRQAGRTREWVRSAEAAAQHAAAAQDPEAATVFLHEALQADGLSETTRGRLGSRLAAAAVHCSVVSKDSVSMLERQLDEPKLRTSGRGFIRLTLGELFRGWGEADRGYRQIARAVSELEGQQHAIVAMLELARPGVEGVHLREHMAWLARATEAAEVRGDPRLNLEVAATRALVATVCGDAGARRMVADLPRHQGWDGQNLDLQLYLAQQLSSAYLGVGHYRLARALNEWATSQGRRLAPRQELTDAESDMLAWFAGEWDGLTARDTAHAGMYGGLKGFVAHARGDVENAERALRDFACRARVAGCFPEWAGAVAILVRIHLDNDDSEAAYRMATECLCVISETGLWLSAAEVLPGAVDAMIACDRASEAGAVVSQFADGIRGRDAPLAMATLRWAVGALAEAEGYTEAAAAAYASARAQLAELPRPYDAARVTERRGFLLLRASRKQGEELLLEALRCYQRLGALGDEARLRHCLREHSVVLPGGGPASRKRGRRGYGNDLSPREREVVGLAAQGHTAVEIATSMGLSLNTVRHHIANARHKLGVSHKRSLVSSSSL
jgi:DNA-binding CsgD family transcriptional regulator